MKTPNILPQYIPPQPVHYETPSTLSSIPKFVLFCSYLFRAYLARFQYCQEYNPCLNQCFLCEFKQRQSFAWGHAHSMDSWKNILILQ